MVITYAVQGLACVVITRRGDKMGKVSMLFKASKVTMALACLGFTVLFFMYLLEHVGILKYLPVQWDRGVILTIGTLLLITETFLEKPRTALFRRFSFKSFWIDIVGITAGLLLALHFIFVPVLPLLIGKFLSVLVGLGYTAVIFALGMEFFWDLR